MAESIRRRVKEKVEVEENQRFTFNYDGFKQTKVDAANAHVKVTIQWGRRVARSFGGLTHRYRTRGNLVMSVFLPLESGDAEAMEFGDRASAFFQNLTADGVEWQTPDLIRVGRAGKWWQFNVICPFYSDELE